jgi:hypothetical protein
MRQHAIPLCLALLLTAAATGDARVIITEIMYNPASPEKSAETEWVEIANVGDATIEIKDWKLDDEDRAGWGTFSITLAPGGVAVLINAGGCTEEQFRAAWDVTAESGGAPAAVPVPARCYQVVPVKWGSLANRPAPGNEVLQLVNDKGNAVCEVNFQEGGDWPTLAQPGGPSIYLVNLAAEKLTDGSLWRMSEVGAAGARECRAANVFVRGDIGSPGTLPGPSVDTSAPPTARADQTTTDNTGDIKNTIDY